MRQVFVTAALAASLLAATPALAQSDTLSYFCDPEGYIRSEQTRQLVLGTNDAYVPCPEAVLQGGTSYVSVYRAVEHRTIYVTVRSYGAYRGSGLNSYEWRRYFDGINARRYYAPRRSQRDYYDGYRAAVRDTRPVYSPKADRHDYRGQYGSWSGGNRNAYPERRDGGSSYSSHDWNSNRDNRPDRRNDNWNGGRRESVTIQRVQARNDHPRSEPQPRSSSEVHERQSGRDTYRSRRRR